MTSIPNWVDESIDAQNIFCHFRMFKSCIQCIFAEGCTCTSDISYRYNPFWKYPCYTSICQSIVNALMLYGCHSKYKFPCMLLKSLPPNKISKVAVRVEGNIFIFSHVCTGRALFLWAGNLSFAQWYSCFFLL